MALIQCKECDKEISDQAVSCPSCGIPVNAAAAAKPEQITNGKAVEFLFGFIALFFVAFMVAVMANGTIGIITFVVGIAFLFWLSTRSDDD